MVHVTHSTIKSKFVAVWIHVHQTAFVVCECVHVCVSAMCVCLCVCVIWWSSVRGLECRLHCGWLLLIGVWVKGGVGNECRLVVWHLSHLCNGKTIRRDMMMKCSPNKPQLHNNRAKVSEEGGSVQSWIDVVTFTFRKVIVSICKGKKGGFFCYLL